MPQSPQPGQTHRYQFRLEGHLGPQWQDWFDGMSITTLENGNSLLTGEVVDQAALFGLLKKVREIGIPLVSVIRLDDKAEKKAP